ncbi:MAG: hypothetical protein JXR96_09805 [Deltaproteobacteria bacterium]|nr:hypothetical protein [Deltaproteobacteria bacterium]
MAEPSDTMTVRLPAHIKKRLAGQCDVQEWQVAEIEAGLREADAGEFCTPEQVEAVIGKWIRGAD